MVSKLKNPLCCTRSTHIPTKNKNVEPWYQLCWTISCCVLDGRKLPSVKNYNTKHRSNVWGFEMQKVNIPSIFSCQYTYHSFSTAKFHFLPINKNSNPICTATIDVFNSLRCCQTAFDSPDSWQPQKKIFFYLIVISVICANHLLGSEGSCLIPSYLQSR